jgi:hypothetical protein
MSIMRASGGVERASLHMEMCAYGLAARTRPGRRRPLVPGVWRTLRRGEDLDESKA